MNSFQALLQREQPPLGSLILTGSAVVAEASAHAGFDFLILDAEHGPASLWSLQEQVRGIESTGSCLPVIRVSGHDPVFVKQVLDVTGVATLLFPMVETPAEASALVAASKYPPEGIRGAAKFTRAARYGTRKLSVDQENARIACIMQLESETALGNAVEIGRTAGVDALFLGLGDLAVAMGVPEGLDNPKFKNLVTRVLSECREGGLAIGAFMMSAGQGRWFLEAGGKYVSLGADLASIMRAGESMIMETRGR